MFLDSRQQNQEFKRKNSNFARAILHQFFYASLTYLTLEENGHVKTEFGRHLHSPNKGFGEISTNSRYRTNHESGFKNSLENRFIVLSVGLVWG
jgi:hypothetical protein